jgi:CheY-like chemotaxis protein
VHVLVAEDDETNRELVLEVLAMFGYSATGVTDGRSALAALAEQAFDVCVVDCRMVPVGGQEVTREQRRIEAEMGLPRMPIIGLTGDASRANQEACLDAGMDAVLHKPLDVNVLAEAVGRQLVDTSS